MGYDKEFLDKIYKLLARSSVLKLAYQRRSQYSIGTTRSIIHLREPGLNQRPSFIVEGWQKPRDGTFFIGEVGTVSVNVHS